MNTPQQSPKPGNGKPAGSNDNAAQSEAQSEALDEALDESFPASDPVAVSITSIEPGAATPHAPPGRHGAGQGR